MGNSQSEGEKVVELGANQTRSAPTIIMHFAGADQVAHRLRLQVLDNEEPEERVYSQSVNYQFNQSIIPENIPSRNLLRIPPDISSFEPETPEGRNAVVLECIKDEDDFGLILYSLSKHYFFNSLYEDQREAIIEEMQMLQFSDGQIICEQGTPAKYFFIICHGRCTVLVNHQVVNSLKSTDSFGELALLHDTVRTASVVAVGRVRCWTINRRSFKAAVHNISKHTYKDKEKFINSISIFDSLTWEEKDRMIQNLIQIKFQAGTRIVTQGDTGNEFYIICEGQVVVQKDGLQVRKMHEGDYFGEQALLYGGTRTATIQAVTPVICYTIGKKQLEEVLGDKLIQIIYRNTVLIAVENDQILQVFSRRQLEGFINMLQITQYEDGDIVIPKGELLGSRLWVVIDGQLVLNDEIVADRISCFGTRWVNEYNDREVFTDNIYARGKVQLGAIDVQDINAQLGFSFQSITGANCILSFVTKLPLFSKLQTQKLLALVQHFETIYLNQQVIVQEGDTDQSFFIVQSGQVQVVKNDKLIRTLQSGNYFGERAMLYNTPRSATIQTDGPVTLLRIQAEKFLSCSDDCILDQLEKRVELQDDSIALEDLHICRILGKGAFGQVYLVEHKLKRNQYALKSVNRLKIDQSRAYDFIMREKNILIQIDHPFIINLVKTLKDENRLYFIFEYVPGPDLYQACQELGGVLRTEHSMFYTQCLVLMLEYLHERMIIHRDLKPENIIVGADGYPVLIDFGTAKVVKGRTFTSLGTAHYMAPELLQGQGYNHCIDFWSVGIMLFEFIYGYFPFGNGEDDHYKVYQAIQLSPLMLPRSSNVDPEMIQILQLLLEKDPMKRRGGSLTQFKERSWFKIPWDQLYFKKIEPPLTFPSPIDAPTDANLLDVIAAKEAQIFQDPKFVNVKRTPPTDWDYEF